MKDTRPESARRSDGWSVSNHHVRKRRRRRRRRSKEAREGGHRRTGFVLSEVPVDAVSRECVSSIALIVGAPRIEAVNMVDDVEIPPLIEP